jgi:hypothetical protein
MCTVLELSARQRRLLSVESELSGAFLGLGARLGSGICDGSLDMRGHIFDTGCIPGRLRHTRLS